MGAYYTKGCDGAAVFDHLAIAGTGAYLEHMNKYNVVYIDFSKRPDVCESYKEYIGSIIKNLRTDLLENHGRAFLAAWIWHVSVRPRGVIGNLRQM